MIIIILSLPLSHFKNKSFGKNLLHQPTPLHLRSIFLVVVQPYETDVAKEYVIRGNDALMKCSIPSFVADVVQVIAWLDSDGQTVHLHQQC